MNLTDIIEEREKNLAYFEKQLSEIDSSLLLKDEKEEYKHLLKEKIEETKKSLKWNYGQLKKDEEKRKWYSNPFGAWRVTTEGDVEGRTTEDLGTYTGYLDFIAYHLADKAVYGLEFKKIPMKPSIQPIKTRKTLEKVEVHVQLNIESGTWGMNPEDRVRKLRLFYIMLKDRKHVVVEDGCQYSSVKLVFPFKRGN